MWDFFTSWLIQTAVGLKQPIGILLFLANIFAGLAIITKGLYPALAAAKRAIHEIYFILKLYILDFFVIGPILGIVFVLPTNSSLHLINPDFWNNLPTPIVAFLAVFVGDFIGYWRHRLEHTRFLWPSHALHHSDTAMTWLTLLRFHPINAASTRIIDFSVLILFGFPAYALVVFFAVKNSYGYFIHADLPWTYGRLGTVFVSPAMHRWHHSIEEAAHQTNFATIFSIFDRMFGTYRVPGLPTTALGVKSLMGKGVVAQLLYPFMPSAYGLSLRTFRGSLFPHKKAADSNQATGNSAGNQCRTVVTLSNPWGKFQKT